jgi:hypothetical protein
MWVAGWILTGKSYSEAKFRCRARAAAHDLRRTGALSVRSALRVEQVLADSGRWGIRESEVD